MRDLPRGTVTLLFTDIEGSTRLLHELGDDYANVLAEHRRAVREAFARHGGVEVDTQGDAFFYAFARAQDAVAAAEDAQRALESGPVRVRIGVHTGEPTTTEEGYIGADVHRAARIMGAGHGGQVLLSEATRRLLDSRHPLRDLGEHRLKDIDVPERLFQLGDGVHPPLKSLNNTNLPLQLEPLLGRKRELAELLGLMRSEDARLVTLTGPGGIGKTRLALELASELVGDFSHGVWFVDLSAVRDDVLVEPTVAAALGARSDLAEHIGDRSMLLVLDNFEQVVDAAPTVARLLSTCANVAVAVTSRESLNLAGERAYPLRPLAEAPAIELFRQRATAAAPEFDAAYADLADVCARLDSLPLAIELAAARAKTLTPDELRARLGRTLPLLGKGRRDAPERQRTLRATIDWSHELLGAGEQEAFARLGVFSGGWTLEAAEAVCDVDVDTLESLVDKSLVRHRDGRYSMLETIREYAAERLDELAEPEALRRRHAEWIIALGRSANLNVDSKGQQQHALVTAESDNVRAALDWARDRGERELEIRILAALENWWVTAGPTREGLQRALDVIERADDVSSDLRAEVLRIAANNTTILGDDEGGLALYEAALAESRAVGDDGRSASVLIRIAMAAQRTGDMKRAAALLEEVRALLPRVDLPRLELQASMLAGALTFREGEHERALALFAEVAANAERLGFTWQQMLAHDVLARRLEELGRTEEAEEHARKALALDRHIGDREAMVFRLAQLAVLAARRGDGERAGRLWGAAEAAQQQQPLETWESTREWFRNRAEDASGEAFERGRVAGLRQTLDEVVADELGLASRVT